MESNQRILLPNNPERTCSDCGNLDWYKDTFEHEPGGRYGNVWRSYCAKTTGSWCPKRNRHLLPGETERTY